MIMEKQMMITDRELERMEQYGEVIDRVLEAWDKLPSRSDLEMLAEQVQSLAEGLERAGLDPTPRSRRPATAKEWARAEFLSRFGRHSGGVADLNVLDALEQQYQSMLDGDPDFGPPDEAFIRAVLESGVPEQQIVWAMAELLKRGIYVEP
jgi:hypothetical protein